MSKKYVISSTIINNILDEWETIGTLDRNLKVYEVSDLTQVYKPEMKLVKIKKLKIKKK